MAKKKTIIMWNNAFQLMVGLIALWLLVQWALQFKFTVSNEHLQVIDWAIWLVLVAEVVVLTSLVKHKKEYLKQSWLNLAIILVCFPPFWFHSTAIIYLRIIRFFILLRVFKPAFKVLNEVLNFNQIWVTLLIMISLTIFAGLFMSIIDPAIPSIGDGVWWAWETITTVGYGDVAPSTLGGRLLAVAVMLGGAAIFSIITANLSAYLISKGKISRDVTVVRQEESEMLAAMRQIQGQLDELKQKIDTMKKGG